MSQRTRTLFAVVVAAFIVSGCATRLTMPESKSSVGSGESMLFGKLEILIDGAPIPKFSNFPGYATGFHISPFTSIDQLQKDRFSAGKFSISVGRPDGFFAAVVAPGDYYVVELFSVSPEAAALGVRSYDDRCGGVLAAIRSPVALILRAIPGQATYLGTIKLMATRNAPYNCVVVTSAGTNRSEQRRGLVAENWSVTDDWTSAQPVFHSLFPEIQRVVPDLTLVRAVSNAANPSE